MGLSSDEEKMLRKLMRKKDEPDAPAASRALNISVDLGDEKQVERARRLGLLDWITGGDDDDDEKNGKEKDNDDDDDDDEETPRRRGYF